VGAVIAADPVAPPIEQYMPLDQVTRKAVRIVHGTVSRVYSGYDESGLPATWISLTVMRVLKGSDAPQLTFKQYGLVEPLPDGTIARVADLDRYRVGEEVVLFLRGDSRQGFTSPVGFSQGAYRVCRNGAAPQVHRDCGSAIPQHLDEFVSEIARITATAS